MFGIMPIFEFFNDGERKASNALTTTNPHLSMDISRLPRQGAIEQVIDRTERRHPNGLREIFTTTRTRMMWKDD